MPKDILIYGHIGEFLTAEFIRQVDEIEGEELSVRINTKGGSPEFSFGMIAKFREFEGTKTVKVDGAAFSMGLFFLAYCDNVEALDVSEFAIHRASYPNWFEQNPEFFTEELRGNLERVNLNLKKAIEAKIDVAKFEEMKGVKMKDIFSMDSRIDVFLSAQEAKKIGLINKINKITPSKKAEIQADYFEMAAKINKEIIIKSSTPVDKAAEVEPDKTKKMTKEEFNAAHPAAYNEIFNAGIEAGSEKEAARIGAWMVYNDIDAKAVKEGIDSGKDLGAVSTAEFIRKAAAAGILAKVEIDSSKPLDTEAVKTAEETAGKNTAEFLAEVKEQFKAEA